MTADIFAHRMADYPILGHLYIEWWGNLERRIWKETKQWMETVWY